MGGDVSDALVFVPAWNEESALPRVLDDLRRELPEADVLVVDDGSTDGTAEVARAGGAHVLSFAQNRGLRSAIAAGYGYALEHGYRYCGRVDGDGQHPAHELRRLLERVRAGTCDVAVGSRFAVGNGYALGRYRQSRDRAFGMVLLRRLLRWRLRRAFADATSGLYAVNERALPLLAEPYATGAPEVEALIRLTEAGLRVDEVPVEMRERVGSHSKLHGRRAATLVVTVATVLLLGRRTLLLVRRGIGRE